MCLSKMTTEFPRRRCVNDRIVDKMGYFGWRVILGEDSNFRIEYFKMSDRVYAEEHGHGKQTPQMYLNNNNSKTTTTTQFIIIWNP